MTGSCANRVYPTRHDNTQLLEATTYRGKRQERPRIEETAHELIRRMAEEYSTWGARHDLFTLYSLLCQKNAAYLLSNGRFTLNKSVLVLPPSVTRERL
jgi:hypothetical protein